MGSPGLLAFFEAEHPGIALTDLADPSRGIRVHAAESVPDTDWEEHWRRGLAPRQIGPLWIRTSWCASHGKPELVVDPERAFGSGEHATTRLALALLLDELRPGETVLDYGTGTGIIALGAARVGAARPVALDVDLVACMNAARNVRRNDLAWTLFCGTLDALRPDARFDLVVANLLVSELRPWLRRLLGQTRRRLVLSGFLESEWAGLRAELEALGGTPLRVETERQGEVWGGCIVAHTRDLQSSSRSRSVSSSE